MAQRGDGPDSLILGRIATFAGDRGFGWASGVAITDGRVTSVGQADQIRALLGSRTRLWRLDPAVVVMPSLTDAHLHLISAALSADEPDLQGMDRETLLAAVATAHAERIAGGDRHGWMTAHGWSLDTLGEEPHRSRLDMVTPDRPVALWSHDHHSRWLNTAALQESGLAAVADRPGGRIVRDDDGVPTGWLLEGTAGLVDQSIPPPSEQAVTSAIHSYAGLLARFGVTAVHDPGGLAPGPDMTSGPATYRNLARRGQLPLRVVGSLREEQLSRGIEIGFHSGVTHGDPARSRYRDGWIKLFADGALGSRTAHLSSPYEADDPRYPGPERERGLALRTRLELRHVVEAAAAAGIASQIHAIGDAATRAALDVLEGAPRVGSVRHRIEHAQLVHPDDCARFGAAGIAASVQACHLLTDADAVRLAWGQRSGWSFPLALLDQGGALLPAGTDAPVESPDPWRGLSAAVTRRSGAWPAGEVFHAEHSLGLERAIRASCLDGPRSLGIADEGRLTPGARADLIVVPAELFDAPPEATMIEAISPLATVLDGEIIARTAAFDP